MTVITGKQVENEGELLPNCKIIRIEGLEPGASKLATWQAYKKIKKVLLEEQPQIVHTHQAKAGFLGRWASYKAKIKTRIHTFHGHVFSGYFSALKSKVIQSIERYLAKISTHIIVISPSIEKDIVDTYKITTKQKTNLIRIGITPFKSSLQKTESREKHHLPKDQMICAFMGRLAPIKNPQMFLNLANNFRDNPNIHFLFVGDGPLKAPCDAFIKSHNLGHKITSIDWVHEIDDILTAVDTLVMTSLNEGTPLMALEAMQAGVPVLSTPVGGVVDIIENGKNGFLCKSEEEFIQTIHQIHSGQIDITTIKNNAKETIAQAFSEKQFYQNTLNLYQATSNSNT